MLLGFTGSASRRCSEAHAMTARNSSRSFMAELVRRETWTRAVCCLVQGSASRQAPSIQRKGQNRLVAGTSSVAMSGFESANSGCRRRALGWGAGELSEVRRDARSQLSEVGGGGRDPLIGCVRLETSRRG